MRALFGAGDTLDVARLVPPDDLGDDTLAPLFVDHIGPAPVDLAAVA